MHADIHIFAEVPLGMKTAPENIAGCSESHAQIFRSRPVADVMPAFKTGLCIVGNLIALVLVFL
jgi:hypothetical protein